MMDLTALPLGPKCRELIEQVEEACALAIDWREGPPDPRAAARAEASFEEETPIMTIGAGARPTEDRLVHELYHLLASSACEEHHVAARDPLLEFLERTYADHAALMNEARLDLQRAWFYPKMIEDGFHPGRTFETRMSRALSGYPGEIDPRDQVVRAALDLWRLEIGSAHPESDGANLVGMLKTRCAEAYERTERLAVIGAKMTDPADQFERLEDVIVAGLHYLEPLSHRPDEMTMIFE